MTAPYSSTQLALRCVKQVLRQPSCYVPAWLLAAVLHLGNTAYAMSTRDAPTSYGWRFFALLAASTGVGLMGNFAQWAFACTAAQGLGWQHQAQRLRQRLRPMVGYALRQAATLLWYVCKPLGVCLSITGGVYAGAYWKVWPTPDIGLGPMETLAAIAAFQGLVCFVWGACLVEARLMLARALVLKGSSSAEAVRLSHEASTGVRGWLLKAAALMNLPFFCTGAVSGFLAVVESPWAHSSALILGLGLVTVPWLPIHTSLPMVALQALRPKPSVDKELRLAA